MSVQRISSFKSFTEVKNQQASIKMHEENKTKREQLLAKIGQTLEEEGVTSFDELDEEKRTALVAKIFNEDRAEDIEADKVKMGEPKKHEDEEGNAVQSTNESLVTEATRSQIGKIDKAGKITSVYVHWDGSPDTRLSLIHI
jgi:FKBP-type peptidyl-prolyl cis-trans isomerase